jgi:hypothetical protein
MKNSTPPQPKSNLKKRFLPFFAILLLLFSTISILFSQDSVFAVTPSSNSVKTEMAYKALQDCLLNAPFKAGLSYGTAGVKKSTIDGGNIFMYILNVMPGGVTTKDINIESALVSVWLGVSEKGKNINNEFDCNSKNSKILSFTLDLVGLSMDDVFCNGQNPGLFTAILSGAAKDCNTNNESAKYTIAQNGAAYVLCMIRNAHTGGNESCAEATDANKSIISGNTWTTAQKNLLYMHMINSICTSEQLPARPNSMANVYAIPNANGTMSYFEAIQKYNNSTKMTIGYGLPNLSCPQIVVALGGSISNVSVDDGYKATAEAAAIENRKNAIAGILSGSGDNYNAFRTNCLAELNSLSDTARQTALQEQGIDPTQSNDDILKAILRQIDEKNGTAASPTVNASAVGPQGPVLPRGEYNGVCMGAFDGVVTDSVNIDDSDSAESTPNCYNYFDIESQSWIICPTLTNLGNTGKSIYDWLKGMLAVDASMFDTNNPNSAAVYQLWNVLRNISNIGFSIFLLFIIFSQISGFGINNYGVKKMLPKLIIAAVLVNLSWIITVLAIDISNILGYQLHNLIINLTGVTETSGWNLFEEILKMIGVGGVAGTASVALPFLSGLVTGGGVGAIFAVAMVIIPAIIAILVFFLTLAVRQLIIIFCVAAAPLAFLLYAFPNTNSLFKKYIKLFQTSLIIYPVCSALYGLSQVIQSISRSVNEKAGQPIAIVAALAPFIPFAVAPSLVTKSVSALGNAGAMLGKLGGTLSKAATGGLDKWQKKPEMQERMGEGAAKFAKRRRARTELAQLEGGKHGLKGSLRHTFSSTESLRARANSLLSDKALEGESEEQAKARAQKNRDRLGNIEGPQRLRYLMSNETIEKSEQRKQQLQQMARSARGASDLGEKIHMMEDFETKDSEGNTVKRKGETFQKFEKQFKAFYEAKTLKEKDNLRIALAADMERLTAQFGDDATNMFAEIAKKLDPSAGKDGASDFSDVLGLAKNTSQIMGQKQIGFMAGLQDRTAGGRSIADTESFVVSRMNARKALSQNSDELASAISAMGSEDGQKFVERLFAAAQNDPEAMDKLSKLLDSPKKENIMKALGNSIAVPGAIKHASNPSEALRVYSSATSEERRAMDNSYQTELTRRRNEKIENYTRNHNQNLPRYSKAMTLEEAEQQLGTQLNPTQNDMMMAADTAHKFASEISNVGLLSNTQDNVQAAQAALAQRQSQQQPPQLPPQNPGGTP